ncbi:MAG: STAS domain-containing protein [Armatimonadota bacterium]
MFGSDCSDMFFTCTVKDGMVHVSGEVDMNTAPTLYDALVVCAKDTGCLPTIDLGGVTYFDSSGVQALVDARVIETNSNGPARIVGVRPNVMRIMRLVGLDQLFDIIGENEKL